MSKCPGRKWGVTEREHGRGGGQKRRLCVLLCGGGGGGACVTVMCVCARVHAC